MDVTEGHARRLPPLDHRWIPRPFDRATLETALMEGGVAGVASHPLDNVRDNISMMLDGDPDKQFGLHAIAGDLDLDGVLDLVAAGAGRPIDREARYGPVEIAAAPVLDAWGDVGTALGRTAARGGSIVIATGHPIGLGLLYHAVERLLSERGALVDMPAAGDRWRESHLDHDWVVAYFGRVGMLADGIEPRHTHSPEAMHRVLDARRPDLVLADHGFAGAAIQAGIETLSVADVNDPALIVARAQARTETVVVMDDHVAPDAYWPCFQACAAALVAAWDG